MYIMTLYQETDLTYIPYFLAEFSLHGHCNGVNKIELPPQRIQILHVVYNTAYTVIFLAITRPRGWLGFELVQVPLACHKKASFGRIWMATIQGRPISKMV